MHVPPTILSLVPVSSTTLNIMWSHLCSGPPTTHYFITTMFVSTAPGFSQRQVSSTLPPSTTSSVLNNLQLVPGNIYTFVVTAVSGSVSQSSAPMQFKIRTFKLLHQFFSFLPFYNICILAFLTAHPSSLSPPTNVAANQLSPTNASISWNPPLQTPNFYFICYFPIELGGSAQFGFAFGIVSSHDVTGLNQGGTYVFIVVSAAATLSAADPVALTL